MYTFLITSESFAFYRESKFFIYYLLSCSLPPNSLTPLDPSPPPSKPSIELKIICRVCSFTVLRKLLCNIVWVLQNTFQIKFTITGFPIKDARSLKYLSLKFRGDIKSVSLGRCKLQVEGGGKLGPDHNFWLKNYHLFASIRSRSNQHIILSIPI